MRLSEERVIRGWSRAELARRAGINATTVGLVESGRLRPYVSQLMKLANALGVRESEAHLLLEDEPAVRDETVDRGRRREGRLTR